MNFTEFGFWPRLAICLFIIWVIRCLLPKNLTTRSVYGRFALAALSLYLLSCVGLLTFSIFCTTATVTWIFVLLMSRVPSEKRKLLLFIGIPLITLPLIYFKYRLFIVQDIFGYEKLTFSALAIPAGISFYTFQKIGMLVDISRLPAWKPKAIDYLNFISFFPQVVAGPIERKDNLFPQMEKFSFKFSWQNLNNGAAWISLGLFYKLCISDNLTPFVDRGNIDSAWPIALTTFLFGFKIYFDFCGYSLIALGLGKFLGINLTLNFRSPYWSRNISDFWRRWHITLSFWFRDYIYFPLGGSRTKRWALNLMIVFIISGIWHGAGWGFILWGACHGLFCATCHFLHGKIRLPWLISWCITSLCVFLSWLPFYETDGKLLLEKFLILASPGHWAPSEFISFIKSYPIGDLATLIAATALGCAALLAEGICRFRKRDDYSYAHHPLVISFCIACVILLGSTNSNEFIYFSF